MIRISASAFVLALSFAGTAQADDWKMQLAFQAGVGVSAAPAALPGLESAASLVLSVGPRFVVDDEIGFGFDALFIGDLDGEGSAATTRGVLDLFALKQFRLSDEGRLTLAVGPSIWSSTPQVIGGCQTTPCDPQIEALRELVRRHETGVVGGMAAISFEDTLGGPFLNLGAELRIRVGHAWDDDRASLRYGIAFTFRYMARFEL